MLKPSRIAVMAFLVFSILILFTLKLMQYQLVDGESYRKTSSKSSVSSVPIIAARGQILDRYGRVLATSQMSYNILIESAFFPSKKEKAQQDGVLLSLTGLLQKSGESWEDSLPISTAKPYAFTGSDYDRKKLVGFINDNKDKKDKAVSVHSSADTLMNALEKIYGTQGYTEAQQRTLIGIRYEMYLNDFDFYAKVYTFAKGVSKNTITEIEENASSLRGAAIQQVPERYYPDGSIAPHVIGITGRINETELAAHKGEGYTAEDSIGKSGIEKSMESYLRGSNGTMEVEQNASGDVTNSTVTQQAQAGDNVVLTIDEDLQKAVQNEIPIMIQQNIIDQSQGRPLWGSDVQGAAAVVMSIKTGEVLAMASYPTYNLNDYRTNYSALASNPKLPLLNRCIAGAYRPGSTFKPITATSGLMNGVITKYTKWNVPSQFTVYAPSYIGSDDMGEPHYGLDVENALAISSNVFFNMVGNQLKMRKLEYTATHIYGIGQKTGIELGGESSGAMSGIAYDKAHNLPADRPADVVQAAIGQLDTQITPLQLANYLSIMLRNGKKVQVHIVKQVNNADNTKVVVNNNTPTVTAKTYITQDIVNTIKEGMKKVAQSDSGTAYSIFKDFNMPLGGKTGTAQTAKLSDPACRFNGLFICFAPYDDPQIAIAVVVEHGHNGYQTAPVARTAIQNYFSLDYYGNPIVAHASATPVGTLLK
jgi:Cell division protein FtsI/penicillin-binding protein 2